VVKSVDMPFLLVTALQESFSSVTRQTPHSLT